MHNFQWETVNAVNIFLCQFLTELVTFLTQIDWSKVLQIVLKYGKNVQCSEYRLIQTRLAFWTNWCNYLRYPVLHTRGEKFSFTNVHSDLRSLKRTSIILRYLVGIFLKFLTLFLSIWSHLFLKYIPVYFQYSLTVATTLQSKLN